MNQLEIGKAYKTKKTLNGVFDFKKIHPNCVVEIKPETIFLYLGPTEKPGWEIVFFNETLIYIPNRWLWKLATIEKII
jgi:hypothetical protein